MNDLEKHLSYGYQPIHTMSNPKPPTGGSGVTKSCDHKYNYLGQRRIKDEHSQIETMTKMVDLFYCEKCLQYKYKDC